MGWRGSSERETRNKAERHPWESLAAERLINARGYHPRDQELANAWQVILASPPPKSGGLP